MARGKFITFKGDEGSGKSTQDKVVVTGIRQSVAKSMEIKNESSSIEIGRAHV